MFIRATLLIATSIFASYCLADNWTYNESKDRMTGNMLREASSSITYSDSNEYVRAQIVVKCLPPNELVPYVYFNFGVQLNGATAAGEYLFKELRANWDNQTSTLAVMTIPNANFITVFYPSDQDKVLANLTLKSKLLLEVSDLKYGLNYFDFSLSGSSTALQKLSKTCN